MITANDSEPGLSNADQGSPTFNDNTIRFLSTPVCYNMSEIAEAETIRERLRQRHAVGESWSLTNLDDFGDNLASFHVAQGLALTVGSAVGSTAPRTEECLDAFSTLHKNRLTRGARAWTKHAHRSRPSQEALQLAQSVTPSIVPQGTEDDTSCHHEQPHETKKEACVHRMPDGWWGRPSGPAALINERALQLFRRIADNVTWKNLHWLPHEVLVYEMRVAEGYGMRWSQDHGNMTRIDGMEDRTNDMEQQMPVMPWVFRGFVEPMMDNGHELGWKHYLGEDKS